MLEKDNIDIVLQDGGKRQIGVSVKTKRNIKPFREVSLLFNESGLRICGLVPFELFLKTLLEDLDRQKMLPVVLETRKSVLKNVEAAKNVEDKFKETVLGHGTREGL